MIAVKADDVEGLQRHSTRDLKPTPSTATPSAWDRLHDADQFRRMGRANASPPYGVIATAGRDRVAVNGHLVIRKVYDIVGEISKTRDCGVRREGSQQKTEA